MAYLLLIAEPVGQRALRTDAEGAAVYARMVDWSARLKAEGVLLAVESLKTESVRLQKNRDGAVSHRDGPYAEAKEMIGGFFLLNCSSREEALRHAAECPAAEWASVEVRETGPCFL